MKLKNISGGQINIEIPGFGAVVDDGATVDIPDNLPQPVEFDQVHWEPVTDTSDLVSDSNEGAAE